MNIAQTIRLILDTKNTEQKDLMIGVLIIAMNHKWRAYRFILLLWLAFKHSTEIAWRYKLYYCLLSASNFSSCPYLPLKRTFERVDDTEAYNLGIRDAYREVYQDGGSAYKFGWAMAQLKRGYWYENIWREIT